MLLVMERRALARRLRIAVSNLIVDDWRLLEVQAWDSNRPVSERSVAFALGWHLRMLLERSWDVDCDTTVLAGARRLVSSESPTVALGRSADR